MKTLFSKDYELVKSNPLEAKEILMKRKQQIKKLENELKCCKNSFRAKCIIQEIERKQNEYNAIDALV